MDKKDLVQPAIRMGMKQNHELLKKLAEPEYHEIEMLRALTLLGIRVEDREDIKYKWEESMKEDKEKTIDAYEKVSGPHLYCVKVESFTVNVDALNYDEAYEKAKKLILEKIENDILLSIIRLP